MSHCYKGALVEVEVGRLEADEGRLEGMPDDIWGDGYLACVKARRGDRVVVEYEHLMEEANDQKRLTETIDQDYINPRPPAQLPPRFCEKLAAGDSVDVWDDEAWWQASVVSVSEDRTMAVVKKPTTKAVPMSVALHSGHLRPVWFFESSKCIFSTTVGQEKHEVKWTPRPSGAPRKQMRWEPWDDGRWVMDERGDGNGDDEDEADSREPAAAEPAMVVEESSSPSAPMPSTAKGPSIEVCILDCLNEAGEALSREKVQEFVERKLGKRMEPKQISTPLGRNHG